jgi:hypothetical protein
LALLTPKEIEAVIQREERLRAEAERMNALASVVLARVLDGVWHTTNSVRFEGILSSGAILPEPQIENRETSAHKHGAFVCTV